MKKLKVFYSWQSDLDSNINRNFILTSLENAAKTVNKDDSIEVEAVIDRDTKDVAGSPHIAKTILEKIDQADLFISDVSIINQGAARLTPNPNVLLELGYAIKALKSENKIILVMNTATGKPEELPFDLRFRRVTQYKLLEKSSEKAPERKKLENIFVDAFKMAISSLESVEKANQPVPLYQQVIDAVENVKPNREVLVRRYMEEFVEEIAKLNPKFVEGDIPLDEQLVQAINQTTDLVSNFARVCEIIAIIQEEQTAQTLYEGFGKILDGYYLPKEFSGLSHNYQFDFWKFIGHELFVTFFSFLIREKRWSIISELLSTEVNITNQHSNELGVIPFEYASSYVVLLEKRKNRLNLRVASFHATLLNERHTRGTLEEIIPMKQFMEADLFLLLRSRLLTPEPEWRNIIWRAWSLWYLTERPSYLMGLDKLKNVEKLLKPLGMANLETYKLSLKALIPNLENSMEWDGWYVIFSQLDVDTIGSK